MPGVSCGWKEAACWAAIGLLLGPTPAAAQQAGEGATARGVVLSEHSKEGVAYARISLERPGSEARYGAVTDSAGRFVVRALRPGRYRLTVERFGERRNAGRVRLDRGQVTEIRLTIGRPLVQVEDLEVSVRGGDVRPRLAGFERRRRRGVGHFFGPEEIRELAVRRPSDLLRRVPGFQVGPHGHAGSSASTTTRSDGECEPFLWINGQPVEGVDVDDLPVDGLLAVEVFRGRSEIPARFLRPDGRQCAAIVVWTRTGRHSGGGW